MQQVKIPPAGESITSATVAQWHAGDGESVKRGDLLVTIETDKVSNELEAESDGTLRILVQEGEEVEIGTVIAEIEDGQTEPEAEPPAEEAAPAAEVCRNLRRLRLVWIDLEGCFSDMAVSC
mgnify:CR=1 FL=1